MSDIFSYFITNTTALYLAIGILSLCIGSFLNVVIYRTPKMMEHVMDTRVPVVAASGTGRD